MMNKMRLFLVVTTMCMAMSGKAQTKNTATEKEYYRYSWIQVRWANKANGEVCFVILMSSGEGTQQLPSILRDDEGKIIAFNNQMDGLNYLTLQGWELFEPRTEAKVSNWLARKKVSREALSQSVKANTYYLDETPKIQLDMAEQNVHIDYK